MTFKEPGEIGALKTPKQKGDDSGFSEKYKSFKELGESEVNNKLLEKEILTFEPRKKTQEERIERGKRQKEQEENLRDTKTKMGGIRLDIGFKEKRLEDIKKIYKGTTDFLIEYLDKIEKNKPKELKESKKISMDVRERIAQLLKDNKVDQIIVAGEEVLDQEKRKENPKSKEKIFILRPDLDAFSSLYIFNNFNKRKTEETLNEGAMTTFIKKGDSGEDVEKEKGFILYIDAGGKWIMIQRGKEKIKAYLDHHGEGRREPTSGTKEMIEIMEKADLLKEKPEWLVNYVKFVNDFDNLTYVEKRNEKGEKTFNKEYFENVWPKTLFGLAKVLPPSIVVKIYETGEIKDPSIPLTKEQLDGKVGKIVVEKTKDRNGNERNVTFAEKYNQIVKKLSGNINKTENSIDIVNNHLKKEGFGLNTKTLGQVIYNNFPETKFGINVIPDGLAFLATKANGFDTYISWNREKGTFFINSNHPNLEEIIERLNDVDPQCAKDVRGVMVYGKIKNLTEEQFLNIVGIKMPKKEIERIEFLKEQLRQKNERIEEIKKELENSGT